MILLVTETNVPALWNLERRLSALEGLGINSEKVRIVVNRWHKAIKNPEQPPENHSSARFRILPNDFGKASTSVNLERR